MSRRVLERYIVGSKTLGLYPADKPVFIEQNGTYGLNGILDNQIVIYDKLTGESVGPGVTVANTPNLVIAQGIDTDGDGVADVLRKPAFDFINGWNLDSVNSEGPHYGAVKILDVGIMGCVEKGKNYSLIIEARTDHTENFYKYRDYERWQESVQFKWDDCGDCDQPIECSEVLCGLANKFNGRDKRNSILKQGSFIKRVREHQDKDKPFHVYPLHANDYEFCFTTPDVTCEGCGKIDSITGVIIDGVTTNFSLTTDPGAPTKTRVGQINRVLKMINDLFADENIGYALDASAFTGTAKPCSDGVKILVNSCKTFVLLGDGGTPIVPCDTGLPTRTVDTVSECGGCGVGTTATPCGYLRIVAKPVKIDKFCDTPDSYEKTLYTDIRVSIPSMNSAWSGVKVFVHQDYEIPRNLAYQALHHVARQDTSANEPFSTGYDEYVGKYHKLLGSSRTTAMLHGLLGGCESSDGLCVYNIHHSNTGRDFSVQGDLYSPKVITTVLIPKANVALKTAFEAIINPWIASAPNKKFSTVSCDTDQDQIERILNGSGVITTEAYPNPNGNTIGG